MTPTEPEEKLLKKTRMSEINPKVSVILNTTAHSQCQPRLCSQCEIQTERGEIKG